MAFEHKIETEPAFDKRHPDPHKNYGVHGLTMRFLSIGPKGAIQFLLYTNWHLPHVQHELLNKCHGPEVSGAYCRLNPMPADIGYHSYVPRYEGQSVVTKSCPVLGGKPCYYDGSSLQAEEYFAILVREGLDALWMALDERYASTFEGGE
jgi:hypothetical protein